MGLPELLVLPRTGCIAQTHRRLFVRICFLLAVDHTERITCWKDANVCRPASAKRRSPDFWLSSMAAPNIRLLLRTGKSCAKSPMRTTPSPPNPPRLSGGCAQSAFATAPCPPAPAHPSEYPQDILHLLLRVAVEALREEACLRVRELHAQSCKVIRERWPQWNAHASRDKCIVKFPMRPFQCVQHVLLHALANGCVFAEFTALARLWLLLVFRRCPSLSCQRLVLGIHVRPHLRRPGQLVVLEHKGHFRHCRCHLRK